MMRKLMTAAVIACATTTGAFADADATIMERQTAMKAVGAAAKAGDFAAMNKAAMMAQAAFQIDTRDGFAPTEARPEIWDNLDAFNAIMDDLVAKSAAADKSVFGSCKACHADYRIKN
jgi:cytochrome c556